MFRYPHLGFDEDGLPLAVERLGHDCFTIEGMRNMDYILIHKAILSYRPDYIIFRLKEVIPILFGIKDRLKRLGTKVIFWFTDPTHPKPQDLRDIIDVMFLSNAGQLEEYKEGYNLKRVYFMPQSYMPYIFHPLKLKEEYDIGFTGAMSKASLHSGRRKLLERLMKRYKVEIRNNVRNNVAEFYSQSRFVFGTSDFPHLYYTSNRFFIALGCGSIYLTKKFQGIEHFAKNKEHLLWFENEDEMMELIDYYLSHDRERRRIGENAQRLAESKHTCTHRLQNMLDIAEGKTEKFYGFLE